MEGKESDNSEATNVSQEPSGSAALKNIVDGNVLQKKRSKSPEEVNHTVREKYMQLRSSKRKKAEGAKNCAKEQRKNLSMMKKTEFFSKHKGGITKACQGASTHNGQSDETSSALLVPNCTKKTENNINLCVPNIKENKDGASTSSTLNKFQVNLDNSRPSTKGSKKQKKNLPKWSAQNVTESNSDHMQSSSQEQFEEELKCSICSEIFINAVTLNCSHSFCQYCIAVWRKEHTTCPICRQEITSQNSTLVLDKCVERILQNCKEDIQKHRKELIEYREKNKPSNPIVANGTSVNNQMNGFSSDEDEFFYDEYEDDENDDDENDDDYYEEDFYDEDDVYFDEDDYADADPFEEEENSEETGYDPDNDVEVEEEEYDEEGYEEEEEYYDEEEEYYDEEEEYYDEEEEYYDEEDSYEDAENEESDSYSDGCFNCGQEGHYARNCPTACPYNGIPGAYYGGYGVCFRCKEEGHWANGCPN